MQNFPVTNQSQGDVEREINLSEYFAVIRKRKHIVCSILAVVLLLTIITTFSKIPLYTAATEVLIERNRGSSGLDSQYNYNDPFFLETQSAIIRSTKVAKRVVENQKLATTYRAYFLGDDQQAPSFFSSIKGTITHFVVKMIRPESSGQEVNPETVESRMSAESLSEEDIIALMIQGGLGVQSVKETKLVRITFTHKSPEITKLVADAVTKAYMDEILDMKLTTSKYALQWMTAKAEEERKKLEDSEKAMQQYMREHDLVTVENKLAIAPQRLTEFSSQLSKAQAEKKVFEEISRQVELAGSDAYRLENISIFAENAVLKTLRESIFKARQNINELSKKFGEKHPVMVKANDEMKQLLAQQQSEINRVVATTKNSYELAQSKERNLQELLDSTKEEMLTLNEKFIQFSIMKREVESNRAVYEALTANIKKEGVTEQSQTVNIWVLKNAVLPDSPSMPNKKRSLAVGLLIGIMAGVGCAFFIEYLDNTVKSENDLENRYGLTVLGTVENLKEKGTTIESYLVQKPLSPLAESYRLIRSGLLLSSAEHPPRSLLITSMNPKEGKTSTTINIARVLGQNGKKVLIIDCDLRRPRVHSVFAIPNEKGLSNFLTGNLQENIINKVPGEEIFVITSGTIPPNPAELVSSRKLKTLVEKMTELFDFVLLDSPPVQSVTDSLALCQTVDGTIVVVRAGVTTYEMLHSGLKKLRDVHCRLLGSVLNGQTKRNVSGSYYHGYATYYAKDGEA